MHKEMPEGAAEGATFKNGKGATNDSGSYQGKGSPDIQNMGEGNMVGPDHTGTQGLSTNLEPMNASGSSINATIELDNLPTGLGAINDSGTHVSIYPTENMTFAEYQSLLNQISWE